MTNPYWPPLEPNVFGALVTPGDIRDAGVATLKLWLPRYIDEISERRNLEPPLRAIQDWTVRPEYRALPQTDAPAIMCTVPGIIGQPHRHGDGALRAHYNLQVSVVVWGEDWEPTEDLTGLYATAVIAALVQHQSLGDVAESTKWLSYRYVTVEHASTRTLGAAQIGFDVEVAEVVNTDVGPPTPQSEVFPPPLVASVQITVDKELS